MPSAVSAADWPGRALSATKRQGVSNLTPAVPTWAITAQIRAIRDYAKEHDAQKVIIQGEMLSALEDLLPPASPSFIRCANVAPLGIGGRRHDASDLIADLAAMLNAAARKANGRGCSASNRLEHDFDEMGFAVLQDRVAFDDAGGFCFERHLKHDEACQSALVTLVRDQFGEVVDLVAMRRDRAATWLGRVGCAGLQNLFGPRLLSDALPIAADALDWLRNERRSVLVINPERAKWELASAGPILASSVDHGRALRNALTFCPDILVQSHAIGIAA